MRWRRLILLCTMTIGILLFSLNTFAQVDLDGTFTAPDATFTVRFPASWTVDDSDSTFVVLSDADIHLTLFSTNAVADYIVNADTPQAVLANLASFVDFVGDETQGTSISGRDAALAPINFEGEQGAALVIAMDDGSYGLIVVVGDSAALTSKASLIIRVAANYDIPGVANSRTRVDNRAIAVFTEIVAEPAATTITSAADALRGNSDETESPASGGTTTDAIRSAIGSSTASEDDEDDDEPSTVAAIFGATSDKEVTLVSYDSGWEAAINELLLLDLISEGGALVFEEDLAFFEGRGDYYTGLARRSPHTNIVIAGELTFTSANTDTIETCGLFARVTSNLRGDALEFVQIGLSNNEEVFYADRPEDTDAGFLSIEPVNIDLSTAHHLLAILTDDELTLFLDGELLFNAEPINERDGTYGIGLTGGVDGSRCEGRNIWVYTLD
jgi:hypothetical protein